MAVVMGATYPDLYAAAGVHSGLAYGVARDLPSGLAAMQGKHTAAARPPDKRRGADTGTLPTIVFHGDRDGMVHPRNADELILQGSTRYQSASGAPLRMERQSGRVPGGHAYTKHAYLDAQGRTFQEHWLIHGGGHAWFGGSREGSYTDPKGPDAAKEMLRFFDGNPRGR
jgi:poly(3-hydroxybutyrate) depolymerase